MRKTGQPRPKRQSVTVELRVCPLQVSYATNVRRPGEGQRATKQVWFGRGALVGDQSGALVLLSDWPIDSEAQALRVFQMYRQRWGVEESFKFSKECLGWEEVQLLGLEGIRTLVRGSPPISTYGRARISDYNQ